MVQENRLISNKTIVIAGPTCVGKSDYAVDIALRYGGEIISADSVQIYRGLDIGSGKITKTEMKGVPHYMLDILDPDEQFTVVDYIERTKEIMTGIRSRGKLPVVVGGTGFYINALLHDYDCGTAGPDYKLRDELRRLENLYGPGYLAELLHILNPEAKVHAQDTTRVIRQLELFYSSRARDSGKSTETIDALLVIMDADRELLDEKAALRINKMIDAGFVEEVKSLERYFNTRCMNTVGYKEVKSYIEQDLSLDETVTAIRQSYHGLIKKQQTFFRWIKWDKKTFVYNWNFETANTAIKEYLNGCE